MDDLTEIEDLRRLRYFVAVAQEASFTRAAQALHVSQPAVSEAVRQLERALGVTLFARDDRPVALTAAGRALLEDSLALLAAAERATARVRRVAAGDEGDIVVASTQSLSAGFIPALLDCLAQRIPQPFVRHRLGWASDVIDMVEDGRATISFARYAPLVAGLGQATIGYEPVVACLGLEHRLAGATTVGVEDLAHERWAIMDRSMAPGWYDSFVASCATAGFEPDIAELVAAADLTAAQATFGRVAAGDVVTYVGASLVPAITGLGVRCVPLDSSLPPLPVDALWRHDDRLADSVLEVARHVCAGEWWAAPETSTDQPRSPTTI